MNSEFIRAICANLKRIMIVYFALGLSVKSYAIHSQLPAPLSGEYTTSAAYKLLFIKDIRNLDLRNQNQRERINELRAQGFTCILLTATLHQCEKVLKDFKPTPQVNKVLLRRGAGITLRFSAPRSDWQQINDSDFLKEWELLQNVTLEAPGGDRDELSVIRLMKLPEVYKIVLNAYWLVSENGQDWSYVPDMISTQHAEGWYYMLAEFPLQKESIESGL
jgi:hypothetical protein